MGSSPSINIPPQQNYSEAMADSLRAQVDLLAGQGQFADTGGLQNLLQTYEAPLRKSTAQTDTDILKQTLLGTETQARVMRDPETGRFGIPDGQVVMSSEGPSAGRYQAIQSTGGKMEILDTTTGGVIPQMQYFEALGYVEPTGGTVRIDRYGDGSGATNHPGYKLTEKGRDAGVRLQKGGRFERGYKSSEVTISDLSQEGATPFRLDDEAARNAIRKGERPSPQEEFAEMFKTLNTATPTEIQQTFKWKDPNTGEDFKPTQEGQTITTRDETGMVDLLGDRRMLTDENRRAGFDKDNNFLGLSALTEDIGAEQQTRSRERDLADVERLSGRYKDVMDTFKDEGIMNTIGEVGGSEDVFLRNLRDERAERAGDPISAVAPSATASSTTTATTAPMPGQQGLRELLTGQAIGALGEGLTDRERRNIEQASRARATTLGRTFDVGSVEDEVTAKLLEDRNRLNQNRAFAQSVLGQEGTLRMQELALQKQNELDPFRAILGRSGGSTMGQAQNILGGAGYGLQSGPAYLNPQAGINYASQAYANQAGLEAARMNASANRTAGIFSGLGSLGGGLLAGR